MKNSSDTIGNPTRDLPACSAVPQPTALPRAPGRDEWDMYYGWEDWEIRVDLSVGNAKG